MANRPLHQRAASASSAAPPPSVVLSNTPTSTPVKRPSVSSSSSLPSAEHADPTDREHPTPSPGIPSLLQPRIAVVLQVPPPWHPWLFALRLLSIAPALWWGLPSAVQLLLRWLPGPELLVVGPGLTACAIGEDARYSLTEMSLATIWCFASGYLSFFFTDCLMSRWLLNYTPQATIIRLLTINALNAYITSIVLYWTGGFNDPRLFLPGWISIATTLTVCYHITHSQINIRKETVTSINVFSIGSTITMITLLVHMHTYQSDYPDMPLVVHARRFCEEVSRRIASIETAGRPEL